MKLYLLSFLLLLVEASVFAQNQNEFIAGQLAFEQQKWSEAQSYFDQWIQTHPTDQEALWLRGQAFQNQGNLDRALSDYNALLVLNPQSAEALFERGRVRYQLKQYQEAITDFENFI